MSRFHSPCILLISALTLFFSVAIKAQDDDEGSKITTYKTEVSPLGNTTTTVKEEKPDTDTTIVEKRTITSAPPKSVQCTTVKGHWESEIWIDTQTVCNYANRSEGAAWVQDYWACTASAADGTCTNWEYRPGHWMKTFP